MYDIARENEGKAEADRVQVDIKTRKVTIHECRLVSYDSKTQAAKIDVVCGGGTYIRSIVHDLGRQLDTCAHMTALLRTQQGPFSIQPEAGEVGAYSMPQLLNDNQLLSDESALPVIAKYFADTNSEEVTDA